MKKVNLKSLFTIVMMMVITALLSLFTGREREAFAYNGPTYVTDPSTGVTGSLGNFKKDDVYYFVAKKPSGSTHGKVYAAGCNDNISEIRIPLTLKNNGQYYDVLGVNDNAFRGKALQKVEIEAGVEIICREAFAECAKLKSVTFGDGLKEIGEYAFAECVELKSVTFGDGLKEIHDYAFSYCAELKKVQLPDSVSEIGSFCFYNCFALESVNCPSKIKEIKDNTFEFCSALKSFNFGKNIKKIGNNAFSYCNSMKTVKFDKALTTIGDYAFNHCESLKSPKFTVNIKDVGVEAFCGCTSFQTVKLNRKIVKIPDGCFYDCTSLKTVKLSANTVSIGDNAFHGCKNLEKITGKNKKLKTIGQNAFYDTWHLNSFSFANVEEIGKCAFFRSHLSKADLGDKLKYMGEWAFGSSGVREVIIPGTLKTVPCKAFEYCEFLKKVELKEGVERVEDSAFQDCGELETFIYPDTLHYVGSRAFDYTMWFAFQKGEYLKTHELATPRENQIEAPYHNTFDYYNNGKIDYSKRPDSVFINDVCIWVDDCTKEYRTQGDYWVAEYKEVIEIPAGAKMVSLWMGMTDYRQKKLIIPEGVEIMAGHITIGSYNSQGPIDVVLPDSLRILNCGLSGARFESIVLPKNLEQLGGSIDLHVFGNNEYLSSVTFTGTKLEKIGPSTFSGCKALTSIVIPEGVEEIGEHAFRESGIKDITLPSTLKTIGACAFDSAPLVEIELPAGLETIGDDAFRKTELKSVKLPKGIKAIGGWAFAETQITKIELPDKFEIKYALTENNNVTYVVKKNSKAHKAFQEFARNYTEGYWKLKLK